MSTLNVDKVDPSTGTALEIGSSGDTITVPSGATFAVSGTMNASSITAGTVATARLGSGTASSSTVLYGDQTYKAEPTGVALTGSTDNTVVTVTGADAIQGEATMTYDGTTLALTTSGGGIKLDNLASSNVNTLDDYERGSWTPAVVGGTKGIDTTYEASYTKIGNRCCITFYVDVNSSGDSTQMQFSGLPFTVSGDGSDYAVCRYIGTARVVAWGGAMQASTSLKFFKEDDTAMPQNEMGSQHIQLSVTYAC